MCMGGDGRDLENMRLEAVQGIDPDTKARQADFWNQAQEYASTSPFQQPYGDASSMPGLGTMSQMGQGYLTNQILGSGAYGDTSHLGSLQFTDYVEPDFIGDPRWTYDPNIEKIKATGLATRAGTGGTFDITEEGWPQYGTEYANAVEPKPPYKPGKDEFIPPMPPITGTPPDTGISPSMGPIDIDRVDGYSSTVGIEEMQRAADASRVLLGQTAPGAPSYTDIATPSIATPTLTATTAISAGTGNVGSRFAEDGTLIDTGYGYDTGVSIDPNTGAMSGGIPKYATDVTTPIVGGERGQFIDTIEAGDWRHRWNKFIFPRLIWRLRLDSIRILSPILRPTLFSYIKCAAGTRPCCQSCSFNFLYVWIVRPSRVTNKVRLDVISKLKTAKVTRIPVSTRPENLIGQITLTHLGHSAKTRHR